DVSEEIRDAVDVADLMDVADLDARDDTIDADTTDTADATDADVPTGPTDFDRVRNEPWNRDLRCPGDSECTGTGDGRLEVGFAARVITPPIETFDDLNDNDEWDDGEPYMDTNQNGQYDPTYMATGNVSGGREATEVHDDLWVRVAVFRKNDITIGLAVWDTFGVFHDEIVDMRRLADAEGLGLDHLLVAATHNHNSFDSIGIDGPGFVTGRNPEHNGHAQAMTIEALGEALQNARPVSLEATSVLTPEAWTRDS